jgi:hypothetical protein
MTATRNFAISVPPHGKTPKLQPLFRRLQSFFIPGLVEAEYDAVSIHQDRPADQVWILRHQPDRLFAGWRVIFNSALAVQFVAGIQELAVIPLTNKLLQFGGRKPLAEVDLFNLGALFAKETLRFPAGGSGGLQVEFHRDQCSGIKREGPVGRYPIAMCCR